MSFRIIFAASLLCLSLAAAAQLKTISEAYEVSVTDLRLPASEIGTITLRKCPECKFESLQVLETTVYEFNGEQMSLEKFRRSVANLYSSKNIPVQVLHHLESNQVRNVWVLVP